VSWRTVQPTFSSVRGRGRWLRGILLAGWLAAACTSAAEYSIPLPTPDGKLFVDEVYPLMLRDCAFSTCHGQENRFFHLYGPGRVRLDPMTTKPDDPMLLSEVSDSYDRARSMLTDADQLDHTLLLNKPLALNAGGQGHKGVDSFGRNVFASVTDPGYALLVRWASSKGAPPTQAQVDAAKQASMSVMP
jgi:hypothetical protein